jgi:soluble lytic murein transglycosylase-like protein
MQITPVTATDIAAKHLKVPTTKYDLKDAKTSIEFGAAYLAYLRDTFCDHTTGPDWACVELIATGYNGGPGAANRVYKGEGLTDTETVVYARDAFNMYREGGVSKGVTYERWLERGGQTLVDKAKTEK